MPVDADRLYHALGARIRDLRSERGESQGDLASALDLSRTSVVNIEAGRQRPPLLTLYLIARHYRVDVPALLPPLESVDAGAVIGRVLDEAVGTQGRSRESLDSLVREVTVRYPRQKR